MLKPFKIFRIDISVLLTTLATPDMFVFCSLCFDTSARSCNLKTTDWRNLQFLEKHFLGLNVLGTVGWKRGFSKALILFLTWSEERVILRFLVFVLSNRNCIIWPLTGSKLSMKLNVPFLIKVPLIREQLLAGESLSFSNVSTFIPERLVIVTWY